MDAYLILGTPFSGRRASLCDLLERGLYGKSAPALLISESEEASEFDGRLGGLAKIFKYTSLDEIPDLEGCDVAFCLADSRADMVDQIEKFKEICDRGVFRLVRILGFVDCSLYASAFDECADFYDAMSHFSDCLILSKRSGVSGKDVKKIQKRYLDMCRPHIFQTAMRDGKLENPSALLVDEARRISMAFDDYDPIDELELDEDTLPQEPFTIEKKVDVYFEKSEFGGRVKKVPSGADLFFKYKNEK